jgi:hypothetical protein
MRALCINTAPPELQIQKSASLTEQESLSIWITALSVPTDGQLVLVVARVAPMFQRTELRSRIYFIVILGRMLPSR